MGPALQDSTIKSDGIRRPTLNTEPYAAISTDTLRDALKDQVVIITGAGGGLGTGESLAFANAGARLALIDIPRAAKSLQETAEQCKKLTKDVKTYFCNVMDPEESAKTIAQIEKDLGPIDILLNNAGGTIDRPFHMETFDQFWIMIDLNFKAPMLWSHLLMDSFRQRRKGKIINIASRSATVNAPFCVNYGAAKAALVRAAGCLQLELDNDGLSGIQIYSLHPGATKTGIQKALPDDVAKVYPEVAEAYVKFCSQFKCKPGLCGQTCVFLATGRGSALRGKYFDCEQDVEYVSQMGDAIREQNLYELKVEFLGGLPNDGGTMPDSILSEL